jgi:hypothetical protein
MSLLARIRSGQKRWGRPSLALVAFAWLNVILQPCAMAMSGGLCPHCPPAHTRAHPADEASVAEHGHEMAGHEHGGGHAAEDGHVTDSGSEDCGGELSDCANLDSLNQGERAKSFSPDFKLLGLAPPSARCSQPDVKRSSTPSSASDSARLAGAYPPLNVLYCVYLD